MPERCASGRASIGKQSDKKAPAFLLTLTLYLVENNKVVKNHSQLHAASVVLLRCICRNGRSRAACLAVVVARPPLRDCFSYPAALSFIPILGLQDTPQWLEIMERISSGEMPPKEHQNPPSAEASAAIVEWLAERMKLGEADRLAARGRVSYNRLTRDEYVNTMRDLIGVRFDATDPGGILEDAE